MATSGIVTGAVKVDNDSGGDGWGNGILTLDTPPGGTNRMRFAWQSYASVFSGSPNTTLGQNLSYWFGLRFSNAHLSTVKIDNSTSTANQLAAADDFLGMYSSSGDVNFMEVDLATEGGVSSAAFLFDFVGTDSQCETDFSFGVPHATKARVKVLDTTNTAYDVWRHANGSTAGLKKTVGWEIYKHASNKTVYLDVYSDFTSLSEANVLNVFTLANKITTYTIHGDVTSNWIDAGSVMSFPPYFIFQWPYAFRDTSKTGPTDFYIPVLGYEYLIDS